MFHPTNGGNCGRSDGPNSRCYFHPSETVVGVCSLCLRERLLVLASRQEKNSNNNNNSSRSNYSSGKAKKSSGSRRQRSFKAASVIIPKVFGFGSFLHRPESRRRRRGNYSDPDDDDDDVDVDIPSLDDSFISIKFDDGRASWDKNNVSTAACSDQKSNFPRTADAGKGGGVAGAGDGKSTVVEHRGGVRWTTRIGHLLQVVRWKRSSKANSCHTVAEAAAKRRRSWIVRSLTRRRTSTSATAAVELSVED